MLHGVRRALQRAEPQPHPCIDGGHGPQRLRWDSAVENRGRCV